MFVEDFEKLVKDNGFVLFDKKDAAKYAECAADAFYDYPLMHDWFEDDIYDSAIRAYMKSNFREVGEGCVVFADSPEINAICMVGRPFLNNVVDTELYKSNIMKIEGHCKYKNLKRIVEFQRYCIDVKNKVTNGDAVHCLYLAVKKSMQGKGLGKKMLSLVHKYAKSINKPVFLDTHKPVNVEIYKKLGYELKSSVPYEDTSTFHNALVYYP